MTNNEIFAILALDCKRVALAVYRNSGSTSLAFEKNIIGNLTKLDKSKIRPNTLRFVEKCKIVKNTNSIKYIEDMLLFSTVFQNASLYD